MVNFKWKSRFISLHDMISLPIAYCQLTIALLPFQSSLANSTSVVSSRTIRLDSPSTIFHFIK